MIPHMSAGIIVPTSRNAPALGTCRTPVDTQTKESKIEA